MKYILKKFLVTFSSLFILEQVIPAFTVQSSWSGLFYASVILSFFLYILRPIINIVMFPINLLTLNLSSWIVQIIIFYIWTVVLTQVKITNWLFPGINFGPITLSGGNLVKWQVIIISAIFLILIMKLLDWVLR